MTTSNPNGEALNECLLNVLEATLAAIILNGVDLAAGDVPSLALDLGLHKDPGYQAAKREFADALHALDGHVDRAVVIAIDDAANAAIVAACDVGWRLACSGRPAASS